MDGAQPIAVQQHIAVHRFAGFTLDPMRGALFSPEGHEVALRPKSFALLRLFVENAGRLLDRDTIMQAVWPDVLVAEDGIVQCVRDIRRGLSDETQSLIKTMPRRGYILTAEVTAMMPPIGPVHASAEADRSTVPASMQCSAREAPVFLVTVRPFENIGGDVDDRRLASGLTEDLVTDLARVPVLTVVDSEMTSYAHGGTRGCRYVVVGSIRPGTSGKLWITVRLVDAAIGACLWADRLAVDLTDSEAAWYEAVGRIAQAIEFFVVNSATTNQGFEIGSDNRAEQLSLQGWAALQHIHTVAVVKRARGFFERALQTDPDLGDAKVGKAMVSLNLIANFWSSFEQEDEARIEQLLFEAIDSNGPTSRAMLTLGMLRRLQDRLPESRIALQVAIASEPHNAWAIRQLGHTLAHLGEHAAAVAEIERSLRLNPYGGGVAAAYQGLGQCHLALNNLERSIALSSEAAVRNPWLVSTHLGLASALASSGQLGDAKATMSRAFRLKPEMRSVAAIRRSLPYTNPRYVAAMNDGFFAGLRRAGMPDQ